MKIFGPNKKMNRTASMQLSINAIVILVMAMAVLGIGLGLIRGVLGSGQEKLLGSLESMDLTQQATASEPFTNYQNIKIKAGSQGEPVVMGFYYTGTGDCAANIVVGTCEGGPSGATVTMVSPDVTVSSGSAGKIGGLLSVDKAGTYVCPIEIKCGTTTSSVSGTTFITATT
jgi:hypothetical protein